MINSSKYSGPERYILLGGPSDGNEVIMPDFRREIVTHYLLRNQGQFFESDPCDNIPIQKCIYEVNAMDDEGRWQAVCRKIYK